MTKALFIGYYSLFEPTGVVRDRLLNVALAATNKISEDQPSSKCAIGIDPVHHCYI